jgi:hypothetical protein
MNLVENKHIFIIGKANTCIDICLQTLELLESQGLIFLGTTSKGIWGSPHLRVNMASILC